MPKYIDPKYNPKIIYMGMDKLGNEIYHVSPDLPTVDVVDKELYDRLLENSIIISDTLKKYQSADMLEVVQCKECIHNGTVDTDCPIHWSGKKFCSFGERREDEEV